VECNIVIERDIREPSKGKRLVMLLVLELILTMMRPFEILF